jgi:hypothetical protein
VCGPTLTAFARAAAVIRRRYLLGDLRRLLREELELAKIVIGLWCNRLYGASMRSGSHLDCRRPRLIVATNLGVVVVLELERESHQGVSDVSGGFIVDLLTHPRRSCGAAELRKVENMLRGLAAMEKGR